jgi:excisionase family DNA binding protein
MSEGSDTLLSVAETAKLLQRSTEQVRRYLREGALPGRRLGGHWFVTRSDAEALLRQRIEGSYFAKQLTSSQPDPLAGAIAVGGSGGANIALGRYAYVRSLARNA